MINRFIEEQIDNVIQISLGKITVYDVNGGIVRSNFENNYDIDNILQNELKDAKGVSIINGICYDWVYINDIKVLLISYDGGEKIDYEISKGILRLIKMNIQAIMNSDNDNYNNNSFYKNLLLGNIEESMISTMCFDLNIAVDQCGYVLIVEYESGTREEIVEEILTTFFSNSREIHIDAAHTAILTEFDEFDDEEEIEIILNGIVDEIRLETSEVIHIAIGSKANDIFHFRESYENALLSLDVGKIFYFNNYVYDYNKLGIAKLIYAVPVNACKKFIADVLPGDTKDLLEDKEMAKTIRCFFKANLNMSVAARDLYVHRNTLVYRLEKINKLTGYNLANFDDAVVINIALMMNDYLDRYDRSNQGGNK